LSWYGSRTRKAERNWGGDTGFGGNKLMRCLNNGSPARSQSRVAGFSTSTQLRGAWNFDPDQGAIRIIEQAGFHGLGSTRPVGTGAVIRRSGRNVDRRHGGRAAAIAATRALSLLQPRGRRRSGAGLLRSGPEKEGAAAGSRETAQLAVLDSQQSFSHAGALQ